MSGREIEFDWHEANVGHVARHSVLPDEVEHGILNDPADLGWKSPKGWSATSASGRQ
jgi:hypothetical protein